ncbi:hypothetical protein Hanom_Chr12g01094731 [Helianthus anomalus]
MDPTPPHTYLFFPIRHAVPDSFALPRRQKIGAGVCRSANCFAACCRVPHRTPLPSSLSQALQNSGVDLTHDTISVQVDIGKRANRGPTSGASAAKDDEYTHFSNQAVGQFQDFSKGTTHIKLQKYSRHDPTSRPRIQPFYVCGVGRLYI